MMRRKHKAEPDLENAFPLGESHLIPPMGLGGYVPDSELTADKADNYRLPTKEDPLQMEFVWEGKRYKGTAYYIGEVDGND